METLVVLDSRIDLNEGVKASHRDCDSIGCRSVRQSRAACFILRPLRGVLDRIRRTSHGVREVGDVGIEVDAVTVATRCDDNIEGVRRFGGRGVNCIDSHVVGSLLSAVLGAHGHGAC